VRQKVAREAEENRNVRATPAIDRLIFITDDANVLFRAGEKAEQIVLDAVWCLDIRRVNVLEALLPAFADGGPILQEFCGAEKEIVESSALLASEVFRRRRRCRRLCDRRAEGFGANVRGGLAVIFGVADFAEDVARRERFVANVEAGHCELDGGELVVVVEYAKLYGKPAAAASRRSRRAQSE